MARKTQPPPASFEEALRELEQILTDIERGEIPLEESITRYERGTFLIQFCQTVLNHAEKQIEQINKTQDGSLKTAPMENAPGQ
jgi:exodeoxyribonuclease VII small subunit